ncbi:hypothetical protein BD31_I0806 [Candidatus Nitrosopumilus salaria BD31]|uniref:Uncharacterized protein n=1 Tax=Candidatus Nitrosopumilus salarius BD31 TaxID=859350 RepID=I3D207_9ARCH|nr:hypothetical protein BD31_I0806 [Candidatus Nitrosopumilus salaria BD31]
MQGKSPNTSKSGSIHGKTSPFSIGKKRLIFGMALAMSLD